MGGTRQIAAKYVKRPRQAIDATCEVDEGFALKMRNAEARLEVMQLRNIEQAGEKNWRASAWLLERMYPDRYGARKAGVLTREEMAAVWDRLAAIVQMEVRCKRTQGRLAKRLGEIVKELEEDEKAGKRSRVD